jgi:hypothetical protein
MGKTIVMVARACWKLVGIGKVTRAATAARLSAKSASRMLRNAGVKERIAAARGW